MQQWYIDRAITAFERERVCYKIPVTLPEPPKTPIPNHDLPKEQQKFPYIDLIEADDELSDAFIEEQFSYIFNGFWFFNNGNLEYITGYHYVMLNYCLVDGERPLFSDAQRDVFYVWDKIEKDPFCMGLCLTTRRRFGKGEISIIIGYLRTILKPFSHFGIQSKSGGDAKDLYLKLVYRWQSLPEFLRPEHIGESFPQTALRFFKQGTKGNKETRKERKRKALNSWVDYRTTVERGYDSGKLQTYIIDEAAKMEKVSPKVMFDSVKRCLWDKGEIIGKALITTTLENEEEYEASREYKKLWDDSNIDDRQPNGRTKSQLYRIFVPAHYGMLGKDTLTGGLFTDEYGYSDMDFTKECILRDRENLDARQLSFEKREMALTEEEAFQVNPNNCYFNAQNIQDQISWLKEFAPKGLVRPVTFYRDDDGKVDVRDDFFGKCGMVWTFPEKSDANKFKWIDGQRAPVNDFYFSLGGDPYAVEEMMIGKGSKGVVYVYRKGAEDDEDYSGMPILRYCDRPRSKEIFYDYVMMIAEYFSIKINMECDIQDWKGYWNRQERRKYMMLRPKSTINPAKMNTQKRLAGTPSKDPFAMQVQFDVAYNYFEYRAHKIYFLELLEDALRYDHTNRTKSDDTVAFMMSLVAATENVKIVRIEKPVKFLQVYKPNITGRLR